MILVALGANLPGPAGGPAAQITAALDAIDATIGTVRACSRFYDSAAWDPSGQPSTQASGQPRYVNAVAAIETALDPAVLLEHLLALETRLGRTRGAPNAPRAIDLDLIDYDGAVRAAAAPILPHPRMHERGFVLQPLAEVSPDWRHPVTGETVAALIAALAPAARAEPLAIQPLAKPWARGAAPDRV